MDRDLTLNDGSVLILVATLVFFTAMACADFGWFPNWLRVVRGVAAVVLALAALVALV